VLLAELHIQCRSSPTESGALNTVSNRIKELLVAAHPQAVQIILKNQMILKSCQLQPTRKWCHRGNLLDSKIFKVLLDSSPFLREA
jgi:hypothetical protein